MKYAICLVIGYYIGLLAERIIHGQHLEDEAVGMKFYKNKQDPELIDKIEIFFNEELYEQDIQEAIQQGKEEIQKIQEEHNNENKP